MHKEKAQQLKSSKAQRLEGKIIIAAFVTLLVLTSTHAFSQFDFGMGVGPGGPGIRKSSGPIEVLIDPFAKALSQELHRTKKTKYFSKLGITTSTTASELNRYMRRGYGRTELITLLLISEGAKKKLKRIANLRTKGRGKRLKDLAQRYKLDYSKIRKKAIKLKNKCLAQAKIIKENKAHDAGTRISTTTKRSKH